MAPEQFKNIKGNFKTDIWSAGSTIVELFMEKDLWAVPSDQDAVQFNTQKVAAKQQPASLKAAKKKHPALMEKVQLMLSVQPVGRPDMKAVFGFFT